MMSNEEVYLLNALADATPNASGWWRVDCPFCTSVTGKSDKRRSMGVLPSKGIYKCFKCGTKGYSPKIIDDAQDFSVAKQVLVEHDEDKVFDPPDGYTLLYEEPGLSAMSFDVARHYMKMRGVSASTCRDIGVGASYEGRYAGRIIVPIKDRDGIWRGWVGRTWHNNTTLRYLYPPGMKRVLFNEASIFEETQEPVLLVEGVFDSFPYWPNVAAFLGKPTSQHYDVLVNAKRPLVVVLDADAHVEGWTFAAQLRMAGLTVGFVRLTNGNDPASVDADWLKIKAKESLTNTF